MSLEERTVILHKIKAYSPRFIGKSWQELPRELKEVLEKSNVEESKLGTAAGSPQSGVNTNQKDDATDDYEGQTEDEKKEQFKHEVSGGDSSPAQTAITTGTTGMYNAVYGKDGRIKGQEKDKDEEDTEKDKEEKEKERKG